MTKTLKKEGSASKRKSGAWGLGPTPSERRYLLSLSSRWSRVLVIRESPNSCSLSDTLCQWGPEHLRPKRQSAARLRGAQRQPHDRV